MLSGEVGGGPGDPACPLAHLLAQVEQQVPVVVDGGGVCLDATDDGDPGELYLEPGPDQSQLLEQPRVGVGLGDCRGHFSSLPSTQVRWTKDTLNRPDSGTMSRIRSPGRNRPVDQASSSMM